MPPLERASTIQQPIRRRRIFRLRKEIVYEYIPDGDRPNNLDVVSGRGARAFIHEGNKRYLRLILAERPGYQSCNDGEEKNAIIEAIYDYILSTGGRFLQFDRTNQKYFHLPKRFARHKISGALRDRHVPQFLKGGPIRTPSPARRSTSSSFSSVPTADDWEHLLKVLRETT